MDSTDIMIKEISYDIDVEKIREELKAIPDPMRQTCLQGVEGSSDPYLGIGVSGSKNAWERERNDDYRLTDFKFPLFDMPYTNGLIEKLGMFHTRYMYLKPKTCYSYHRDRTKRIHIVVTTNEDCWLVVEEQIYHLPINDSYYIVDTTKMHTAINASTHGRIHIVGIHQQYSPVMQLISKPRITEVARNS